MAQIFHSSFNTIAKVSIVGGGLLVAGILASIALVQRSSYVTGQYVARQQPVPFSHEHHVGGLGIDCRYCHTSVEQSHSAGMPNTKTCMTCHSQIWTNAEMLRPVRDSWRTGKPLAWTRVNDVPDFAHFPHHIHVQRGVSCVSCHGKVNEMPLMWKDKSLQMQWCLDCHKNPVPNLRPNDRGQVFDMDWTPAQEEEARKKLGQSAFDAQQHAKDLGLDPYQMTRCSICHY
jgi:hypothetical protein